MAHKSSSVISLLNACFSSHDGEVVRNDIHRDPYMLDSSAVTLDSICPADLRGILGTTEDGTAVTPSQILIFPGFDISAHLMRTHYPSDGRHYGPAMYIPFLRALQGVAHEFMAALPPSLPTSSSGNEDVDARDAAWKNREQDCVKHFSREVSSKRNSRGVSTR